ncbi:DUF4347 domain-containing protein [Microcoleus sp. FACHB-53]|nr:DUF4347 domain-containing protein [Microcoleus sp. FACHB-53]
MSWEIGTALRSRRNDEIAISDSGCRVASHKQNVDEVRQVLSGIAFIDSGLDDYQSLVAGVASGIEVVVLDSTQDGVEQISRALAQRQRIGSIHIVSHGAPGAIYIGNRELSLETLNQYGSELLSWADWLASDAEVLIYGCEVAKGDRGQAFIHRLSELTGAAIAASATLTGSSERGGNWELEFNTGSSEASEVFQPWTQTAYSHVLATFSVTNTNDSGAGSLRQAILDANAAAGADTIEFSGSIFTDATPDTINLTSGTLNITGDTTITGTGASNLSIARSSSASNFGIFNITGANVNLSSLTVTNGVSNLAGGIFYQGAGTLNLTNTVVSGNRGSNGAGLWVNGTGAANVVNSTFANNTAPGGLGGGILLNTATTINIIDSQITGNSAASGGGINNNAQGGIINVTNSTVSDNTATDLGGGISNRYHQVNVINSTIFNNTAGNSGGGIYHQSGTFTVSNSTVSGNRSNNNGGGIYNDLSGAVMNLLNSTITNNIADNDNNGSGNGGGVARNTGTVNVKNTIIAGNFDSPNANTATENPDVSGIFNNQGNNLIGINTGSNFVAGGLIGSAANPVDALLAPLANNGGSTLTHALLSGSLAINAGSNTSIPADTADLDGDGNKTESIPFDQRDSGFTRLYGSSVDIGAFEVQPPSNTPPTLSAPVTVSATEDDAPLSVNLLANASDPNAGDTLNATNLTLTSGNAAGVTINGNSLSVDPSAYNSLSAGENEVITYSYNIIDGNGGSVSQTATLTINGVNDAPVLTTNTLSITEGGTVTLSSTNLNTNDPDNTPAQLLYTISNISGGSFSGTGVTNNSNGSVSFSQEAINNGLVQFTHDGGENPPSYAVSVSDGALNTTPATVTIPAGSFTPVNDAPVLATNTLTITEGGTVTLSSTNLNTSDSDNTPAQLLYTISNISSGSFSGTGVTTNSNGTVSFSQDAINNGLVQFTHDGGENPPSYAVSVSDGALNTTPATVSIPAGSFIPVNDAPVATGDTTTTSQNTAVNISVLANDSDIEGNSLSLSLGTNPSNGTVQINNNGTASILSDDFLTYTPNNSFSGTDSFNYTINDGNGGTATATVTVAVGKTLDGTNKDDLLDGTSGNDIFRGGNGQDTLNGFAGDDLLDGGNGKDTLNGGVGNDTLLGGNGEDVLVGGDGNDLLIGGNSPDTLTGGTGSDIFAIAKNGANDTITDFSLGQGDRIGLSEGLTFGELTFQANNILRGTEVLATLTGFDTTTLTQANFIAV